MWKVQEKIGRKCGYCGYYLPQSYDLMKHSCFHPFDDETNAFNIDENFIVTVVMKENLSEPEISQLTNDEDDMQQEVNRDELLITCVARKRALFDHRIPANERSNLKKKALWQEVCNLMGGVLSVDEVKRRWRYLRDCYMKAKKKEHEYTPSGSAADESLKKKSSFRFYQQMQFLDDVQVKSVTCNSLSSTANNASINEDSCSTVTNDESLMSVSVPLPMDSGGSSSQSVSGEIGYDSNKKRKLGESSKSDEELHESVIAALREPIAQPDGTSAFLITLGEGLRKLPYRKRTKLEIKFLSMVLEEQDNLVNVT